MIINSVLWAQVEQKRGGVACVTTYISVGGSDFSGFVLGCRKGGGPNSSYAVCISRFS